ncbi:MAG: tetratricopeptide repeat protein, partial [Fidelibacterota bacterium]
DARDLLQQAQDWMDKGELDSAETRVAMAIETNPTLADGYYLMARLYLRRYDLDKAREYLLTSIDMEGHNQEYRDTFERVNTIASLMAGAKRSLEGGDPYIAIGKYETVMEQYPEVSALALYHMGLASMRADEIGEAAGYFKRAVTMDPLYEKPARALKGIADKLFNEGNQNLLRGNYEGATASYEQVLELSPTYYRAYYQLGVVRTRLGEFDRALELYKKTVEVEPAFAKGWFALALAHQRKGDLDSALDALDRAISVDPGYAKAYAQKGVIYVKQGDYQAAERAYNQAIQADPTYVRPYEDLGKIFVRQEKFAEAVQTLTTATALDASSETAWYMLAQSYNALGQCESAKEAAHSALDVKDTYAPAWFELGRAEVCLGNKTAALNAFEKARRDRSWRKAAEYEIDRIKHPEKYRSS